MFIVEVFKKTEDKISHPARAGFEMTFGTVQNALYSQGGRTKQVEE